MPNVIVPAGMMMGEYHRPGSADETPEHWQINVGGLAERLTLEEMSVWVAAMMHPEKQSRLEGTRAALHQSLDELEGPRVAAPDAVIDDLIGRRLLVEIDPVEGDIERFARTHRLLPTGVGMGNTHEDPLAYRIAVGGQPRTSVDGDIYTLWANTVYFPNIWESCAMFAKEMNAHTTVDPETPQLDATSVARALTASIPVLVGTEAAVLDPIFD